MYHSDLPMGPYQSYYTDDEGTLLFVRVCEKCGRFVKADPFITFNSKGPLEPNATCTKCGRTSMPCEGWY